MWEILAGTIGVPLVQKLLSGLGIGGDQSGSLAEPPKPGYNPPPPVAPSQMNIPQVQQRQLNIPPISGGMGGGMGGGAGQGTDDVMRRLYASMGQQRGGY